jgi:hypothetical protein
LRQVIRWLLAVGQNDYGANLVADLSIGFGNDGGLDNRRVSLQRVFDFRGRDEDTAALETIVAPAGDEKVAIRVLIGQVAGDVPAVANDRLSSLGVFVVT